MRSAPEPKRLKLEPAKHTYAVVDQECEDEVSSKRNTEHLKKEIGKLKPKPDVVRELIKRTLKTRRDMVMGNTRPEEMISEYPHLRKARYVSCIIIIIIIDTVIWGSDALSIATQVFYEFDLTVGLEGSYESFVEAWSLWKQPILDYASSSISKPKTLQHALRDVASNDPGNVIIF